MMSPVELAPGHVVAGRYRLDGRAGPPGLFEAARLETGEPVYVRLWPESLAGSERFARFERDMAALQGVRADGLATPLDVGESEGRPYLVVERHGTRSWARDLSDQGEPLDRALALLLPIFDALTAAHERGVCHGWLTPDSLVVAEGPGGAALRIVDWGHAQLVQSAELSAATSQFAHFAYMAPERLAGASDADVASDVYGAAALLFRVLTGRPPVEADNPIDVALRWSQLRAPSLAAHRPDLPAAVVAAIERALARAPQERYASVRELVDALGSEDAVPPLGIRTKGKMFDRQALLEGIAGQRTVEPRTPLPMEPALTRLEAPSMQPVAAVSARRARMPLVIIAVLTVLVIMGVTMWLARSEVADTVVDREANDSRSENAPARAPTPSTAHQRAPASSVPASGGSDNSDWD